MKRIIALILSLIMAVSTLTACQSGEDSTETKPMAETRGEVSTETEPMAETREEAGTETITEPVTEPITEPVTEPITEPVTEPDPYDGLTYYETSIGLSLYMCDGFTEGSVEGVQACYEGENSNVRFQEETFASLASVGYDGVATEEAYAALIIMAYQLEGEVLSDEYGNVYIYYEVEIQGTSVSYYGFFDKGTTSFWMTTFMCLTAQKDLFEEDFKLWASSIQVP